MTGTILLIVALILMAMVLFLLEILTPSLGLLAIMGLGAMVGAIWAGFSIHSAFGWTLLVASVVLTPIYLFLLRKWLPSSKLGRMVFLGKPRQAAGQGTPNAAGLERLVGAKGVAATDLRPAGKITIGAQRIEARAESTLIDVGAAIRVISATGTEVVVSEIAPDDGSETPAAEA